MADIRIEPSWKSRIGDWFAREDMQQLSAFLRQRKQQGARIYPPGAGSSPRSTPRPSMR
jgi:uracil-DNA glycosylase